MSTPLPLLQIEDLHVEVAGADSGTPILSGINLEVPLGEVHALMGRNGSGKSSLSAAIMGHPAYTVTQGRIRFLVGNELVDLTEAEPEERAKAGLFLAFQYPIAIPGVSVHNLIRHSMRSIRGEGLGPREFRALVKEKLETIGVDPSFMTRSIHDGFSGGEKKRLEVLQMALLEPRLAILDETDSGLDVEALRVVADGVDAMRGPERTMLVITHYH
ncbi:MAG: Fe-S cluster assembly ATPase SufC, partial [Planctomycetota bacterium]